MNPSKIDEILDLLATFAFASVINVKAGNTTINLETGEVVSTQYDLPSTFDELEKFVAEKQVEYDAVQEANKQKALKQNPNIAFSQLVNMFSIEGVTSYSYPQKAAAIDKAVTELGETASVEDLYNFSVNFLKNG